jgi:hypothetical protein
MTVLPFPIPEDHALDMIREAAKSQNVIFPRPDDEGPWYRLVTRRQVMLCLKEGDLAGPPKVNDHGDLEYEMVHFSAGVNVRLWAVLKQMGDWTAVIIKVENKL